MKTDFRKIRRERLKLTQKEVAEILGVTQGHVSKFEASKTSLTLDEAQKLLDWAGENHKRLYVKDFLVSPR